MEGRGKKSAASLEVVRHTAVTAIQRPSPTANLTSEQAEIWQRVVDSMPAEWFKPETYELLECYCRHAVSSLRIGNLIESMLSGDSEFCVSDYDKLLKMQERESRALFAGATKMRLTQQTDFSHKKKRNQPVVKKPWQ
jgi:hypothetical protein